MSEQSRLLILRLLLGLFALIASDSLMRFQAIIALERSGCLADMNHEDVLSGALLYLLMAAQTTPEDPGGWNAAKWGVMQNQRITG